MTTPPLVKEIAEVYWWQHGGGGGIVWAEKIMLKKKPFPRYNQLQL